MTTKRAAESVIRITRPQMADSDKIVHMPIESCIAAAKEYLTPEIQGELAEQFGAYFGRAQFPAHVGLQLDDYLCQRCLPRLPIMEAHRLLGYNCLLAYAQTPVMRAMTMALRLMPIEQIVRALPRNYAATYSFGSYEVGELAPKHWRFELTDYVGHPSTTQGSLEAGSYTLRNDAKYRYAVRAPGHFSFDITWEVGRLR